MNRWALAIRSIRHHWRAYLALGLGSATTVAVITGALLMGDSVKGSLAEQAALRLGGIAFAVAGQDHFFAADLAVRVEAQLPETTAAPVIQLWGNVVLPDESRQASRVQVLGVDDRFWSTGGVAPPSGVAINSELAAKLDIGAGDVLIVRVERPGQMPRDANFSAEEEAIVALRLKVETVLGRQSLASFGLAANQLAPYNLFIPRADLAEAIEREGRANLLLLAADQLSLSVAEAALAEVLVLEDTGLEVRTLARQGVVEIRSPRVFLQDRLADQAAEIAGPASRLLTYFVNELRNGERATPYSMVVATEWPTLADDEIVLNRWTARDLLAKVGDRISLTYHVMGPGNLLHTEQRVFTVREIVDMEDPRLDAEMMPLFPGLHDAESCQEWETGLPIDLTRVRPADETYWERYGGLPKAAITLSAGQDMWKNRFGQLTAVRLPLDLQLEQRLRRELPRRLGPAALGLMVMPVGAQAQAAYRQSTDVGALFLGFSFFLIVAALLLVALLFGFHLKGREHETGLLLAVGFPRRSVIAGVMTEVAVVGLVGAAAGCLLGVLYAQGLLTALQGAWRGAVGDWPIRFHVRPASLVIGPLAGFLACLLASLVVIWRSTSASPKALLSGERMLDTVVHHRSLTWKHKPLLGAWGLVVCLTLVGWLVGPHHQAMLFFAVAGIALLSGLGSVYVLLTSDWPAVASPRLEVAGVRNLPRQPWRSLAVVSILACGTFLVLALEAQRLNAQVAANSVDTGTGGYDYLGTTTVPLYRSLADPQARSDYELEIPDDAELLTARLLEGDDASCLNLNRVQRPRLAAFDSRALATRGAFRFVDHLTVDHDASPWTLLQREEDGVLPAIGDYNSIVYILGKKIGDELTYTDEHGRTLRVKLVGAIANSVLRDALIVDEAQFLHYFPSHPGYRLILLDGSAQLAAKLENRFVEQGLDLRTTVQVQQAYNRVQNTYISMFQVLGGLGMILGSLGMGLLVVHHVLERRSELAVMEAVGFPRSCLMRLLVGEHAALLALGLGVGVIASLFAVLPVWARPGAERPIDMLLLVLIGLAASGLFWIWLAARWVLRGSLLAALRRE